MRHFFIDAGGVREDRLMHSLIMAERCQSRDEGVKQQVVSGFLQADYFMPQLFNHSSRFRISSALRV